MKSLSFLLAFLLVSLSAFCQSNYFVSTSGNDANNGAIDSPWRHIQYGINQLTPGATLNIRGGVYEEKIDIDVSGSLGQMITIKNYAGEEVILDAVNSLDDTSIIYTDNSYIRIEGLHLTNNQHNYAQGIFILGSCHHIEIVNNKISNIHFSTNPNAAVNNNTNAVPLYVLGNHPDNPAHDIFVSGNEIFNCRTGYSENLSMGGNVDGILIENNVIHDNTNIGIDLTGNYGECPNPVNDHARNAIIRYNLIYNCNSPYSSAAGIYIDGGKDVIVENNVSHHNGYGGEIGCEENGFTDNVIFRNNLFYLNAATGMHIGAYDESTSGIVTNSKVLNNTFYGNDTNNWFNGSLIITKFIDGEVSNNIFYISSQNVLFYAEREQTNMIFDHNLIFATAGANGIETTINGNLGFEGLSELFEVTGYGANDTFGDPLFINPSIGDFHIAANSPAIDAGNPNYSAGVGEVDIDGQARVNNGTIDCGTDEFYSGASPDLVVACRVLLQGAYEPSVGLMNDHLRTSGYVPLTEPYTSFGYNTVIGGGESTTTAVLNQTGNNAIVDWVLVELRNGSQSQTTIATQAALLQRDGDIVGTDGVSPLMFNLPMDYPTVYVVIRHRNHLDIRTNNAQSTSANINLDFTNSSALAVGINPLFSLDGDMLMYSGDANIDGTINATDKTIHWNPENSTNYSYLGSKSDFNLDGAVNAVDLNLFWRGNNAVVQQFE